MGDRSNIVIEDSYSQTRVYLYAHWSGQRVIHSAIKGLESGRTRDAAYLARIVFQDMIKEEAEGSETGFGISAGLTDNEHAILVISDNGTVWFEEETQPVAHSVFLKLIEEVIDLADKANRNKLYDELIKKVKSLSKRSE